MTYLGFSFHILVLFYLWPKKVFCCFPNLFCFLCKKLSLMCLSSYCGRETGGTNQRNTIESKSLINLLKVKSSDWRAVFLFCTAAHIFLTCPFKKRKHGFSHSANLDSGSPDCLTHSNCCCLCVLCKLCIICLTIIYKTYIISTSVGWESIIDHMK